MWLHDTYPFQSSKDLYYGLPDHDSMWSGIWVQMFLEECTGGSMLRNFWHLLGQSDEKLEKPYSEKLVTWFRLESHTSGTQV